MPGIQELMVIALVALLVFGPERLPELARRAGRLVVRLRAEAERNVRELRATADIGDIERDLREVRDELRSVGRSTPAADVHRTREPAAPQARRSTPPPTDSEAT